MLKYKPKKIKQEKGRANLEYIVGMAAGVVFAAFSAIHYFYQHNDLLAYTEAGASIGGFLVAYLSRRKMRKLEQIIEPVKYSNGTEE